MAILEVRNIEKHFGRTNVLKDVSFSMEEGNALAIIGSSGSGKTTLLRCLNFLERPDSGQIIVNGETLFDASEAGKDKPPVKDEEAYCKAGGKLMLFFGAATFLMAILVFVNVYVAVAEIIICTVILGILWKRMEDQYGG